MHSIYKGGSLSSDARLVLVTGASGQLGRALRGAVEHIERLSHEEQPNDGVTPVPSESYVWWFLSHDEFDILDPSSLLSEHSIYAVVNCAAYTAVDRAESEPEVSFKINAEGPRVLADCCRRGESIVHISTDYVFGGQGNTPFHPESVVSPCGVYACSKRAGEEAILNYDRGMVVRTGWLYSYAYSGFFRRISSAARAGEPLRVVYDQVGCPTWAYSLARMLIRVVERGIRPGVWHMANAGAVSWFDFACAINRALGGYSTVTPIRSSEFPSPVTRPSYSVLDCQSTFSTYGSDLCVPWVDALTECLALKC